jgi:excisionase family DNA binding protein
LAEHDIVLVIAVRNSTEPHQEPHMPDPTPESEPLLRTRDVARALGCTPEWVRQLIAKGDLPGYKVGRLTKVRPEALRTYLESRAITPAAEADRTAAPQAVAS